MIRQSVVCYLKKNLFRRYHNFPQTKPRLDGPALASLDTRPGQSPHEAGYLAWLGPAYFSLALAGSQPQAGPGKTLLLCHRANITIFHQSQQTPGSKAKDSASAFSIQMVSNMGETQVPT